MSQDPEDPSTSTSSPNSQTIFADALKQYKKRTKKDIAAHSLAAQIESCDSSNAVLTLLQAQVQTFDPSPSANERWTRSLHPTITVLCAFSGFVSNIAGPVFPLAAAIFTGIGVLLQAVKDIRAAQDMVIGLFDRMNLSFMRLEKYIAIRPTTAMIDMMVKFMVEVISILGIATKEIVQGQFQKYVKKLFRIHHLGDSLQRLDEFTIEILTIAARIDEDLIHVDQLHNVDTNIHSVVHEVSFTNTGVRREGIRAYKRVSDINWNESRKDLRRWISPPDRSSKFYAASEAHHEGTAAWCIEGRTFVEWMASGSLFWIHGKPGSGKTILSSVIIRHIESLSKSRSIFLAYFYFDCKDTGKQGSRALLSSLLVQLSNQSDQMCDVLRGLYSKHRDGSEQPANDVLIRCLKDMLTIARSVPIYLVMDALDECPNDSGYPPSREMVLSVVKELVELRLSNLRLCVTSRPEWDIRIIIKPLATQEISLHDESGQNQDINAYVTFVVQSVKHWRDDDKTMVIDKLTEDADGMFRWVYCKLDVLRQCHRNDLRRFLKELPRSLDETYERILKEINDANQKQAHRLLQCLVAAQRPLRVEELVDVLALVVDEGGIPGISSRPRWTDHEAAVLSTCSSLVSVIIQDGSQVVQFCHTSVKEFLMSDRLSFTEQISQFHIAHESSHTILAQACLGALLSEGDEDGARHIPLSEYACEYWLGHAQVGNVKLQIKDALDRFFDPEKPYFAEFSRSSRAPAPFKLALFRASSDEESKVVLSPAATFYLAAILGLSGLAERLIVAKKPQVLGFCGHNGTLLHLAVREGRFKTARLLLAHGADVNSRIDYATPPRIASPQRHSQGLESHSERPLDGGLDAIDDIESVLLNTNVDVNSGDISDAEMGLRERRFTPLHLAASEGHLDICQMLLEHNADVRMHGDSGDTPLHLAASSHHLEIVRILLQYNAEVNSSNEDGCTPLLTALSRENALDDGGSTSSHQVSQGWKKGDLNIVRLVRLLLDYGANVNVYDTSRNTPLHFAASEGHFEVARMLLERGADIHSQNDERLTPLQRASQGMREGHRDIVRLLLDYGANCDARDNYRNTALHFAASAGNLDGARILLELGAEVDSQNNEGLTPLLRASQGMREGLRDLMRVLLDHGANRNARDNRGNTVLHLAASEGHLDAARMILELGVDVDPKNNEGLTPFLRASQGMREGHRDIMQLLLRHDADYTVRDNRGNTALHLAASEGRLDVASMLLELGVDVDPKNNEGFTPLRQVSQGMLEGHRDIMWLLLYHGANLDARDNHGNTALHFAASEGHLDVARMLLELGADVDSQNNERLTPLQQASQGMREGHRDIVRLLLVRLLLDHRANRNTRDNRGIIPLALPSPGGILHAARSGQLDLCRRTSPENNVKANSHNSTPLHLASQYGHTDVVRLLLDNEASADVRDGDGNTPLHCAAGFGHLEIIRMLLERRAGINYQNNQGWTPLHRASGDRDGGNSDIVQLLLDYGADARAQNFDGKTAYEVARDRERHEIVQLLSQHATE